MTPMLDNLANDNKDNIIIKSKPFSKSYKRSQCARPEERLAQTRTTLYTYMHTYVHLYVS